MAYEPKYISLGEVPVGIPDDYDEFEKRDAIEWAEGSMEEDLNDGVAFNTDDLRTAHFSALKNKATCFLAYNAESTDDSRLPDLEDSGENISNFALGFCKRYDRFIKQIEESNEGIDEMEEYVYTTEAP